MSGKYDDKISMVAWICFKHGEEPRLIYAIKPPGDYPKNDFPRLLALLCGRLDDNGDRGLGQLRRGPFPQR